MFEFKNVNISIAHQPFMKNINWRVDKGEIIRLVGENGSGKSTLIEVLLSLRDEFTGKIVRDFNPNDFGYLPQVAHQHPKIHLQFKDICALDFSFYDSSLKSKNWHTSSGGERKKALIAKAISEAKSLLILDEPFNHLDKESSLKVIEHIREMASKGVTVIYTGHEHTIPGGTDCEVKQWKF